MLIQVPEHTARDLAVWRERERSDAAHARTRKFRQKVHRALDTLWEGRCDYASVSWGKDSTVLAHLAWTLAERRGVTIPLAWVRVKPIANPHCVLVRDAFLRVWSHPYREVESLCRHDETGWHATGTLERGFEELAEAFGTRYATGLRAEESSGRARRMDRGLVWSASCAPIGRWSTQDVFAYLHRFGLPVHPAYAMSMGGALQREHIRVASIGGRRGHGFGRREWEEHYYRAALDRVEGLS